jgi:Protein of unknown function (DUF4019)
MKIIYIKLPRLIIILIFAVAALTVSCSLTKGKEQGERAVEQFHQQFNAGQYQEMYQQSDDKFREAATEEEFVQLLEAVKRKLGSVGKITQSGWQINATPLGTVVSLGYEVEFSDGKGVEQFSFLISGEQAKLLRYDVNSPLLITR